MRSPSSSVFGERIEEGVNPAGAGLAVEPQRDLALGHLVFSTSFFEVLTPLIEEGGLEARC